MHTLERDVLAEGKNLTLEQANEKLGSVKGDLLYIRAVLAPENAEAFGIELKTGGDQDRSWYSYNLKEGKITGDTKNKGSEASTNHVSGDFSLEDGKLSMEIYVDRSLVEAYFNDEKSISMRVYSEFGSQGVQLFADGDVNVDELYVAEMNGIY